MAWSTKPLTWAEIHWPRPLETEPVLSLLTHLATIDRFSQIVFEVRAKHGHIHFLIGAEAGLLKRIEKLVHGEMAGVRFSSKVERAEMVVVRSVKLSRPQLTLNTGNQTAVIRSVLAALAQTKRSGDETVLQVVLGHSFTPSLLPNKLSDPTASWLDLIRGSVPPASAESRSLMKGKTTYHGFAAAVRIGGVATDSTASSHHSVRFPHHQNSTDSNKTMPKPSYSIPKAVHQVRNVFTALKVAESAGVRLRAVPDKPRNLNLGKCPWFYPMRLSIRELVSVLAWPLGEDEYCGVAGLHPRILLPPAWYKGEGRCFGLSSGFGASSDFGDTRLKLGISAWDSLEHTVLLGPTGSGKSTAMLNLILADIRSGRSVLVIDPKADLVNDVLARIPESRLADVVVLDPTDACPVGFNPLADRTRNPSLVADSVLAVFRDVFADSWGVRTQDILSAALLTLVRMGNVAIMGSTPTSGTASNPTGHTSPIPASLVLLPALLADTQFRHKVVSQVVSDDPLGLGAFWAGFEAMSVAERNQHIAPVMNKLRQFLLRPQLRNVLGQTEPKFSLSDLFSRGNSGTGHKIVLVPLNKGVIGGESARLLGSLIVGQLWTLALGRANLSPEQRHIVSVFIDEVQDYLSLPTDLADALSQARGLGVGLTVAHQYRAQLPASLKAGIDANARNKIVFGLNATDAKDMAAMAAHEGLEAMDFTLLPRYGVYANLQQNGKSTSWVSGSTLPNPPETISAAEARAVSQATYGRDAKEVEVEFLALLGHNKPAHCKAADTPIGRKKRGNNEAH
jgi:energy-coupling factor transporter ATP-binding protein EcfA2